MIVPNYKEQMAYEGFVKSLTSSNSEGTFDILPMHENFVTVVEGKVVVVDEGGKTRDFEVGKAVIEASNNFIKVFVQF